MKYACVTTNLLDLWVKPRFDSGRASQLFFGEVLKVEEEQKGFCRVRQADGYSGWVDSRFLMPMSKVVYKQYQANTNAVVVTSTARLYDRRGKQTVSPHILYYGTRLSIKAGPAGFARIVLPDSNTLLVKAGNIKPINRKITSSLTGLRLVAEAKRFLGVPYLWGGITVTGFDCSGLVRTVFSRFGVYMPRDTKDQISMGEKVDRDCIKTGDLLFFRRHVGLAIGRTHLVHASRGGNGVRINALVPGLPDYREDLDRDFVQARRMVT
jgi:cell wall-associated NlpC family hydrolase